jgi:hypothetical protein
METEVHFVCTIVDGEELYCPDDTGWQILKRQRTFRGSPFAVEKLLWPIVQTSRSYPELRVALGRVGKAFDEWRPYVIVDLGSRPTRIQLQPVKCESCGWTGIGGTTAEPDLFVAFGRDFQEKYEAAQEIPATSCPQCGQTMPKHIVWCSAMRNARPGI